MFSAQLAQFRCPECGYPAPSNNDSVSGLLFRPWHVIHGRLGVRAYIASLGEEAYEWLLALYVDAQMQLLSVETIARGDISSCPVPMWHLISRAKAVRAAGFILVHNHPSGNATPSQSDIISTCRLAHVSRTLDVPLLDHIIIASNEISSVGYW
jgi:DNA repair protein RadC